eukprot:TRINITY_DN2516_c0_g1_i1.p1 TRINITY_DN2516_c0_g1~~TRINITY_DN2516_c0_g1_i1.p1  ORF type:complete len:912 (-),score=271.02 TRINITY_DN2516_c0_g1_i1:165-2900(-)
MNPLKYDNDIDVAISKSINNQEGAPKAKHIRKIILQCNLAGATPFFRGVTKRNLGTDEIVAFKALIAIHHLLQEGTPRCLEDSYYQSSILNDTKAAWQRVPRSPKGYSGLIVEYCNLILAKVNFHHKHTDLPGDLSLDKWRKKDTIDTNAGLEISAHFLELQDAILQMQSVIFQSGPMTELKGACIVRLVTESYNIYSILTFLLKKLAETVDSLDVFSYSIQRYLDQYNALRTFYFEARNVKYVSSIIMVPMLSKDPPRFSSKPIAKKTNQNQTNLQDPFFPTTFDFNSASFDPFQGQGGFGSQGFGNQGFDPFGQGGFNQAGMGPGMGGAGSYPQGGFGNQYGPGGFGPGAGGFSSVGQDAGFGGQGGFGGNQGGFPGGAFGPGGAFPGANMGGQPIAGVGAGAPGTLPGQDPNAAGLGAGGLGLAGAAGAKPKPKAGSSESGYADDEDDISKLRALLKAKDDEIAALKEKLEQETQARLAAERQAFALKQQLAQVVELHNLQMIASTVKQLDESRNAIDEYVVQLDNPNNPGNQSVTLENVKESSDEFWKWTCALTDARSNQSTDDLVDACKNVASSLKNLLDNIKGASAQSSNADVKQNLIDAARNAAFTTASLLDNIRDDPLNRQALESSRNDVKRNLDSVERERVNLTIEREGKLQTTETDSSYLEQLAHKELMAAAAAIEQAAEVLRLAMQRNKEKPAEGEGAAEITDAVLNSASAIAQAVRNLVAKATLAQKERVEKGRAGSTENRYKPDKTWSEGLISAAKSVAGATGLLVEIANNITQGRFDRESLIAGSKEVAASTIQLVSSCRVKADPNSQTMEQLETASKAVLIATNKLVEATKFELSQSDKAKAAEEDQQYIDPKSVYWRRKEVELQAEVLRAERALEETRKKLFGHRNLAYQQAGKK